MWKIRRGAGLRARVRAFLAPPRPPVVIRRMHEIKTVRFPGSVPPATPEALPGRWVIEGDKMTYYFPLFGH